MHTSNIMEQMRIIFLYDGASSECERDSPKKKQQIQTRNAMINAGCNNRGIHLNRHAKNKNNWERHKVNLYIAMPSN